MASNQPLAFGALIAGGLLITSALTGNSLAQVASGQAKSLSTPSGGARMGGDLAGAINSVDGLVNPFSKAAGLSHTRVDMGEDFDMTPGSPILALGRSRFMGTVADWYAGQPYIYFQLLNEHDQPTPTAANPHAGKFWYVAEQIIPASLRPGQVVAAGQPIATYASHGTGIEAGFGASGGRTLAQATTGYTEGQVTIAGKDFQQLLQHLGVAA